MRFLWRRATILATATVLLGGCLVPPGKEADPARERTWAHVEALASDVSRAGQPRISKARYDGCESKGEAFEWRKQHFGCSVARSVLLTAAANEKSIPDGLRRMAERLDDLDCESGYGYDRKARSQWKRGVLTPAETPSDSAIHESVVAMCGTTHLLIDPISDTKCPHDQSPPPSCLDGALPTAGSNAHADELLVDEPYPADAVERARMTGAPLFWIVTAEETYYAR